DARRAEVLLRAGIDQPVLADVQRAAVHVARRVGDEGHAGRYRGLAAPLRAVDGVVGGEVHVGWIGRVLDLVRLGDAVGAGGRAAGRDVHLAAQDLRLLHRLLRPHAGEEVVRG